MAVTELALLHYRSPSNPSTSSSTPPFADIILKALHRGAREQAAFSKYPVTLLQCHEDPALIYLVGGWDSIEQHTDKWITGRTNQELMEILSKDIEVKWMFHLNVDPNLVSRLVRATSSSGVVAIGRHLIKPGCHDTFFKTWSDDVGALEEALDENGKSKRGGGWRADRGVDPEAESIDVPDEFVLFSAWQSVERHLGVVSSEGFRWYGEIRDYLAGENVRHGKVFFVAEVE